MKVTYNEDNHISRAMEAGQRKLDISFFAKGLLSNLPGIFMIPEHILKEYVSNSASQFFLNVDFDKEPAKRVIDKVSDRYSYIFIKEICQ